jgi:glycosyltransferase involved in cell wall biosynthesis
MFTPMPPTRTGVAHYASMLLPALRQHTDVEVITANGQRPTANGQRVYQLGNNPHHEWIYKEAMQHSGVIVLHDIVLHHLIVEMTLARGDVAGYVAALEANHGAAGAAWARGRAAGLHGEMGNFLLPASIDVANRSRAVIVHNRYSAERIRDLGVRVPIHVVPHPYEPHEEAKSRRDEIRAKHGFTAEHRIIGMFGFLTSAKRSEVVLEAFARACDDMPNLQLLIVGEPAPDIDIISLGAEGVTFTGYVPDEDFPAYFAAVDRLVNLRYPTAGETSGTLIRAFEAGKPVAVSDYAQFTELPDDCVVKIPFGDGEVEALADFFLRYMKDPASPQRRWLKENAQMEKTVEGYLAALQDSSVAPALLPGRPDTSVRATLPLFPHLELVSRDATSITIRNIGDMTLRASQYGEPGYHIIANGRWLDLPGDLPPGEVATIDLPMDLRGQSLDLFHAMQGIPDVDPKAWVRVAIH